MKSTSVHCDECGTEKKETNHWWNVWVSSQSPRLVKMVCVGIGGPSRSRDACGQECVNKMVDRWMSTGSLVPFANVEALCEDEGARGHDASGSTD